MSAEQDSIKVGIQCRGITSGSGPARYTQRMINGLASYDSISLVLFHPKNEQHKLFDLHEDVATPKRLRTPIHELNMLPTELAPTFYSEHLDIFHYPMAFSTPLFFLTGADNTIATIHGVESYTVPRAATNFRHRIDYMRKKLCGKLDRILTVSNETKRNISKYYQYSKNKIKVTHNEVTKRFRPKNDRSDLPESVPERYFLNVSNINKKKNIDRIIRATRRGDIQYPLVLTTKKESITKQYGIDVPSNVYTIGRVPDSLLPPLYSCSEGLVFPSLQESFGMPIIEAMACACPVVTSNRSAMSEIAGDSAILITPESVSEIREAMDRLWENTRLREVLVQKGLSRSDEFRPGTTAKQVYECYNELL